MIEVKNVEKSFGGLLAVNGISLNIECQQVFGLVGTNGAGKSTLLRLITGVLKPDAGSVMVEDREAYDCPEAKAHMFFISDDPYFFPNSSAEDMGKYYASLYSNFDAARFKKLTDDFSLDPKLSISHYSKGMKRLLSLILGLCATTQYLICDETFDGLDAVIRRGVKSLFASDMYNRGLTPIVASHNLRELEDFCDHLGLLHSGGLLLSEDLAGLKAQVLKLQCVFKNEADEHTVYAGLHIVAKETQGRLRVLTVKNSREEVARAFGDVRPVFLEILPLNLEEIFISEMEVAGYDIKKILAD